MRGLESGEVVVEQEVLTHWRGGYTADIGESGIGQRNALNLGTVMPITAIGGF